RGGVRYGDLVELERPVAPQRYLLKCQEVRLGDHDLSGQQVSPDLEVGLVDDSPGRVRAVGERNQLGKAAGRLRQGSADWRVEVCPEVEVSRHHRYRLGGRCR